LDGGVKVVVIVLVTLNVMMIKPNQYFT
jgi:hypothetical protein